MANTGQIWLTKSLSERQNNYAQKLGLNIQVVPQIEIQYLEFPSQLPEVEAWIFTSQNAVKSLPKLNFNGKIYASGKQTSKALKAKSYNAISTAEQTAHSLAEKIIADDIKSAIFFCGNKRRDELPDLLNKKNISLSEQVVYRTILTPTKINAKAGDAIFFLSPSAITSYEATNTFSEEYSYFCVGNTTADALKQRFTKNIYIANEASLEAMLEQYATENK